MATLTLNGGQAAAASSYPCLDTTNQPPVTDEEDRAAPAGSNDGVSRTPGTMYFSFNDPKRYYEVSDNLGVFMDNTGEVIAELPSGETYYAVAVDLQNLYDFDPGVQGNTSADFIRTWPEAVPTPPTDAHPLYESCASSLNPVGITKSTGNIV